jgi:hypothetical protein
MASDWQGAATPLRRAGGNDRGQGDAGPRWRSRYPLTLPGKL